MAGLSPVELSALLARAAGRMSLRSTSGSSVIAGQRRAMSGSRTACRPEGAPSATPAARPSLGSLITDTSPLPSSSSNSASTSRTPAASPSSRSPGGYAAAGPRFRSSIEPTQERARYRLHAHCGKHNTILSLTKDLQIIDPNDPKAVLTAVERGVGFSGDPTTEAKERDAKQYGQTVARASCGSVGFRKAQRGTFEAATRCAARMFEAIEQLGTKDRKTKNGTVIRDPRVGHIELVLKGFGPGREALTAALSTTIGSTTRRLIRQVTDETPIKIGGVRPKKRRKLSPPLDLSRRRR